jgi:2-amino-4-hydroxy-6-hydroxymethyldihydropteridine diphosphokinase
LHTVYLGLGSNQGDRLALLKRAIVDLGERIIITAKSHIYETEPWGVIDQPDFLNMCVEGKTELGPHELLQFVKQIEKRLGRKPRKRWGPREIDIDILFFDQLILDGSLLTIPHKGVVKRATVLVPLADIASDFRHPVNQKTISDLLDGVDTSGIAIFPIT